MADLESQVAPSNLRKERTSNCFIYCLVGFVILCSAVLVFAVLILHIKPPEVKLRFVNVKDLNDSPWPPSFNTTLAAEMTVKNPNFGVYEFEPSTVSFLYCGSRVGSSVLVIGEAKGKKTAKVSFGVDVRSNRLPEGPNTLISDIDSGMVKLSGSGTVSGRFTLWKIIKKRMTGKMDCTMTLVVKSKTIEGLVCR
ncbi:late embryogenesis abundant protein [Rosa sericea]